MFDLTTLYLHGLEYTFNFDTNFGEYLDYFNIYTVWNQPP